MFSKCKSLMFLFSSSGIMELIGIFVGHLYFFLMFKYPQDFGGQRFLSTPSILYVFFLGLSFICNQIPVRRL